MRVDGVEDESLSPGASEMPTLTDRGLHAGVTTPNVPATLTEKIVRPVEIDLDHDAADRPTEPLRGMERRRHHRYSVAPMYSAIRVRTEDGAVIDGHLRDISIGGASFESMTPLAADDRIRFEIELPGRAATLRGVARVVRVEREHEALDDCIVALAFERFETRIDSATLTRYLEQGCLLRAA